MRRYTTILLATGAIALLASLAFAGYFTSDGRVYPLSGPVYFQIFKWSVEYNLDENQPAPVGVVQVWKSGFLEFEDMMSFTRVEGVVYYWYYSNLGKTGNYAYRFYTFDDMTLPGVGLTVY